MRERSFFIYEGNHPKKGNVAWGPVSLPLDNNASMAIKNGQGSIIVRMNNGDWPSYLEISGPCISPEKCLVVDLAQLIVRR